MKEKLYIFLALVGILFGAMTLKTGGFSLFTEEGRVAAGNYVPFVLWFNFLAGFFYIVAGVGILLRHLQAVRLARFLALSTALVFVALLGHIVLGGVYKNETLIAMTFRLGIWTTIWLLLARGKAARVWLPS